MSTSTEAPSISIIGLFLSLFGYLIVVVISNLSNLKTRLSPNTITLLEFSLVWLLVGIVIFIILRRENRPMSSIGLKSITVKEVLVAFLLGITLSLTVPLLTLIFSQIIPSSQEGSISAVTENTPVILLLISVLTAGITEEVLFRGYPIERILEITKNKWVAVFVPTIAFVLPHIATWNLIHIFAVVIPLGFILAALYIWKRNLIFNMIVHTFIDLPLVFIAIVSNQN